jgi:two-component system response regulator AdeR
MTEVLVVDDEVELAELYGGWLDGEYDVRTAHSGGEAVDELPDSDVVLLDRRMPDLSGDEVLAIARDRDVDCRVAMVTAVTPEFDVIEMGFDDYLVKPVSRTELRETVECLERRSAYDQKLQRYFSLVSRRATLKREKRPEALATSEEFHDLEERIGELRSDLDAILDGFDDSDYSATLRDVAADAEFTHP